MNFHPLTEAQGDQGLLPDWDDYIISDRINRTWLKRKLKKLNRYVEYKILMEILELEGGD